MREDMAKVIVERPRIKKWCRWQPRNTWKQIPWDEQPSQIGKLRQWRSRKTLNENLAPLRRFLRSRVGALWSDVHSELRERINLNSAVQLHIWQHVEDYVRMATADVDRWRGYYFYVDGDSGELRLNPDSLCWKKKPPAPHIIERGNHGQFRRIEGAWKNLVFKPIPREWEGTWDAYFKCHLKRVGLKRMLEAYGRAGVYTVVVLPPTPCQLKGLPK